MTNSGVLSFEPLREVFKRSRHEGRLGFMPFLTAGHGPGGKVFTVEALLALQDKGGADVVELGIPFSDPTAGQTESSTVSH